MSNFPCSIPRNIASHSMKNMAFHSLLRWKMILLPILTTSLMHFYLQGLENVLFELRSERIKDKLHFLWKCQSAQLSVFLTLDRQGILSWFRQSHFEFHTERGYLLHLSVGPTILETMFPHSYSFPINHKGEPIVGPHNPPPPLQGVPLQPGGNTQAAPSLKAGILTWRNLFKYSSLKLSLWKQSCLLLLVTLATIGEANEMELKVEVC